MVLDDVAKGAGMVVERAAAAFHAHGFRGGDLHVVDELPVHDRLKDRVAETEGQQVLNGLLAQVVVDAVNLMLVQPLEDLDVQRLGRGEVVAERFFDDDPPPALTPSPSPGRRGELLVSATKLAVGEGTTTIKELRIGSQVKKPVAGQISIVFDRLDALAQAAQLFGIGEVGAVVADSPEKAFQACAVRGGLGTEFRQRLPNVGLELLVGLCAAANAHNGCLAGR